MSASPQSIRKIYKLRTTLRYISILGGDLDDNRLTNRTGANDARHRGLMYCEARRLALEALAEKN